MSATVQATCPGCKKKLRIPAEWMHQPIRCKHCGKVLAAKRPASASAARPAPPPPARSGQAPAPPPARSPGIQDAARSETVRPLAQPGVEPSAAEIHDAPFDDLDVETGQAPNRDSRAVGILLVVCLFALLLLGGAGFAAFVKYGRLLTPPAAEQADIGNSVKNVERRTVADEPPVENPQKPEPEVAVDHGLVFPRRALLISVHSYLFANLVGAGMPTPGARKIAGLPDKLCTGLRIPRNQIAHLSDAAPRDQARPPLRRVIEETLTGFLGSSRAQDRVMVFFIGHAVELGDTVYLVPLEGELDKPETLIPLKWVYDKLGACPARQKVLVMDVCRLYPLIGAERPGGEPMGKALAKALATPPAGVQVWSACGQDEQSYETEDAVSGVFIDSLQTVLEHASEGKLRLQARIQRQDDLLPLEHLKEAVDSEIAKALRPLKLVQNTQLSGTVPESGAKFDPAEPVPPPATLAAAPPPMPAKKLAEVRALLADIEVPPVKPLTHDFGFDFSVLPPFDATRLAPFAKTSDKETELEAAVRKTQVLLFAVSGTQPPQRLAAAVEELSHSLHGNLTIMREGYRAQKMEDALKKRIRKDEEAVAPILRRLTDAREDLLTIGDQRAGEPKRWQVNYDYMLARIEAEIAYVYEYQSMLGQMRREPPPLEPDLHGGWKLAASTTLTGDSTGKKLASSSRKLLDKIIKESAGTPWEVLAKRDQLTALGLEWKPAK